MAEQEKNFLQQLIDWISGASARELAERVGWPLTVLIVLVAVGGIIWWYWEDIKKKPGVAPIIRWSINKAPTGQLKTFVSPPEEEHSSQKLMENINKVYMQKYHRTRLVCNRSAMVVTANCLLPSTDKRSTSPDYVRQIVALSPVDNPVDCFRMGSFTGEDSPIQGEIACSVWTAQKKSIEIILIPIISLGGSVKSQHVLTRQLLFFFHPALEHRDRGAAPYTLTVQEQIPSSLAGIAGGDGDWLSITSDRCENTEIADLVAFLPKAYSRVMPSDYEHSGDAVNVPGRKMSVEEMNEYGDPPTGFTAVGWRGFDVKVGQTFGVHLRMPSGGH